MCNTENKVKGKEVNDEVDNLTAAVTRLEALQEEVEERLCSILSTEDQMEAKGQEPNKIRLAPHAIVLNQLCGRITSITRKFEGILRRLEI